MGLSGTVKFNQCFFSAAVAVAMVLERQNVATLKLISCNSTHFAMGPRKHFQFKS
jgi:hypothetical protein